MTPLKDAQTFPQQGAHGCVLEGDGVGAQGPLGCQGQGAASWVPCLKNSPTFPSEEKRKGEGNNA